MATPTFVSPSPRSAAHRQLALAESHEQDRVRTLTCVPACVCGVRVCVCTCVNACVSMCACILQLVVCMSLYGRLCPYISLDGSVEASTCTVVNMLCFKDI